MTDQQVTEVMTSPVLTVAASGLASHVGRAMARESVRSVVVTDDCRVDGIFTATDYISRRKRCVTPAQGVSDVFASKCLDASLTRGTV